MFNRLIAHQAERGRENELSLARLLENLIPGRFGIGTGLLFDGRGKYSKQMDLLLFDRIDSPTILAQTNQLLYPVEEIRLCIEIKSRLVKAGVEDAAKKKDSVQALQPAEQYRSPTFALFAYDADTAPETVGQHLASLADARKPDLTCVLDPGILAGQRRLLDPSSDDSSHMCGLTLLHELDPDGARMRGRYVVADPTKGYDRQAHNGSVYPVVDFNGQQVLSDPSRALLLFCEAFIRLLAEQESRPRPVLSHYLDAPYRDIQPV